MLPPAYDDKAFAFIHNIDFSLVRRLRVVVLATDADGPGRYAALQLAARLLSKHKHLSVWHVDWSAGDGGKDANEVLVQKGERGVWAAAMEAQQMHS